MSNTRTFCTYLYSPVKKCGAAKSRAPNELIMAPTPNHRGCEPLPPMKPTGRQQSTPASEYELEMKPLSVLGSEKRFSMLVILMLIMPLISMLCENPYKQRTNNAHLTVANRCNTGGRKEPHLQVVSVSPAGAWVF